MSPTAPASPVASSAAPSRARRGEGAAVRRWALTGVLLLLLLVLGDLGRGGGSPVGLVQPGQDGPAVAAFRQDFPDLELPDGLGLDGQMTYAVARDPLPLSDASDDLDRPRYRLQRPLLAWAGALVHPVGGGLGLVLALFAIGLAGVTLGALALGRLSVRWGGPAWVAAVFPLLPGAYWALRVTTADALAVALALAALGLASRARTAPAVAVAVLAVLAKEPTVLIFAGWALAHRSRRDTLLFAVPASVAAGWFVALRLLLPGAEGLNGDIGLPFVGLVRAWLDIWSDGQELVGMASTLAAITVGVVALVRRGLRHPLGWAIALQLGLLSVSGSNPLGMNFGGTRTGLAVMALAVLALATPSAVTRAGGQRRRLDEAPMQGATGRSGPGRSEGGEANRYSSTLPPPSVPTGQ